jgi:hypothetical protein
MLIPLLAPEIHALLALQGAPGAPPHDAQALDEAFAAAGIELDVEAGLVGVPAAVLIREDLLEYVLVAAHGAQLESLFVTDVRPSILNAALLLLGAEPGTNVRWQERSPRGTAEAPSELSSERPDFEERYEVFPPEGFGFYLHAAWRRGDEVYLFRVEDLIANLETGASMRRQPWVFLGSRFAKVRGRDGEVFVADLEGNVVNLTFFFDGNTLVTASDPECLAQSIWIANLWLVPPRESEVLLVFARAPLERLPAAWEAALADVSEAAPATPDETDGGGEARDAGDAEDGR